MSEGLPKHFTCVVEHFHLLAQIADLGIYANPRSCTLPHLPQAFSIPHSSQKEKHSTSCKVLSLLLCNKILREQLSRRILIIFRLRVPQFRVNAALFEQLLVTSPLGDPSLFEDGNIVAEAAGGKAV